MQATGRIVVELYEDVPTGAARFADLAKGIQGVGFRRTKFDTVNEVRAAANAGVSSANARCLGADGRACGRV